MTMTEPAAKSSVKKAENGQINEIVTAENDVLTSSVGQEVNKFANKSGGVSQPCEDGGPLMRQDSSPSPETEIECANTSGASQKRAVCFQDDCVAGYLEAPDPWKDAKIWTSQEVLAAYRKSCEKHNTKPLNKILQQIQDLVDSGKRQDQFSLKGEKLDHKHCESIEEIFRRIQFRVVDLEGCHLEDESAVALFDMIEFYDSACQLNISFNKNIGLRGWQACSKLIRRTPHLTHVDMRNCDLNDRYIPIIGRALKLGSPLTVLHMENISLSGRPLIILVAALKMNETLQELFLADNKLMPSDGIQLGNLLKYNHKLELLDLRNNHLQDVGTGHLCDGLFEQNLDTGLKTLVLWNNQITYQAMAAVAKALKSVECLETLNLGHNNITNEGMHIVKDGLLKSKSLLRLGLQGTKVSCEGAVALAEFVADSSRLVRLDLRENDIKTAGLMALSLAMRVNTTVVRLDLDRDTKKESGMKDYAEQQRRLHQEILMYGERNQKTAVDREEKQRKEIEERARQEAARQSVEEVVKAAQEVFQSDLDYIPSAEKIQRPKLLFSHILTPQQSLESPGDFKEDSIPVTSPTASSQNLSLCLSPPTDPKQLLSTPPADMLLSPQYASRLTAKKIFSVSRVVESLPSPSLVAGQPGDAPPVMKLLTASPVPRADQAVDISPATLCQDLATETVKEYIEQIVSEVTDRQENSSDLTNGSCNVVDDNQTCPADDDGDVSRSTEPGHQVQTSEVDSRENNTGGTAVVPDPENCVTQNERSDVLENGDVELSSSNQPPEGAVSAVCDSFPKNCDNDVDSAGSFALMEDSAAGTSEGDQNKAELVKSDPSVNSIESEQWQTVESADLQRSADQSTNDGEEVEKPDFHTNLSLNGLARELASALDGVEEQGDKDIVATSSKASSKDADKVESS